VESQDAINSIKNWLKSERLEFKEVQDPQALIHLHCKYPPTRQGHMFNIVVPKNRNLVLIYSITRVDIGQQKLMTDQSKQESEDWENWLHNIRIDLTTSDLDWVLHIGHKKDKDSGPLQAFNLSRPIWFDGLTQNEFMHTMRKLWLTKLSLIHQIKYGYGSGTGKPGPVDDWIAKKSKKTSIQESKTTQIDTDETGGFGKDFDPSEWI
jgi:hypothetical protein|tara:strand:+ start:773 stop:1396 length:624 start_codon:yes stop_codon:yes gene_type:complete